MKTWNVLGLVILVSLALLLVYLSPSEKSVSLGKTPTYQEMYDHPFIQHIRVALNGYLDGSNTGVEQYAIKSQKVDGKQCGLDSFDKAYYEGKFAIIRASDSDYGGIEGEIVFVDKPDTKFFFWVYDIGEPVLRGFCKEEVPEDLKGTFPETVRNLLKEGAFPFLL